MEHPHVYNHLILNIIGRLPLLRYRICMPRSCTPLGGLAAHRGPLRPRSSPGWEVISGGDYGFPHSMKLGIIAFATLTQRVTSRLNKFTNGHNKLINCGALIAHLGVTDAPVGSRGAAGTPLAWRSRRTAGRYSCSRPGGGTGLQGRQAVAVMVAVFFMTQFVQCRVL